MELFKLFGSIMVDNKKANDSISKTDGLVGKLSKALGGGIKTVAKWGAGLVAAATAGGAALLGVANKSAETADRIDKMSLKLGLSRQGFQEWDHIMSQSGMNIDSLQGGMKKLTGSIDDAINGSKSATKAFNRIGVSIDDLKGKSPEQIFELTVKKLQKMPDGAEKAALANDLLGKSASEMAPILAMSAEETEKLRKEAHDLGLVMGDDAVDAGMKFGDTMANLKDSFGMVVTNIGTMVMPIMQKFADCIISNMPTIQHVAGIVFTAIGNFVTNAVNIFQTYFVPTIQNIIQFFKDNWVTIETVVKTVFDGVSAAINFLIGIFNTILLPAIQSVIQWVKDNWGQIKEYIQVVFDGIKAVLDGFIAVFKWAWDMFGSYILDYVSKVFNMIKGVISGVLTVIQGIIKTVTAVIRGDWKGAWEGIKQIFTGIWDTIKSYVTGAVDVVKSVISGAWGSIKNVTTSIWNGIKSAITTPIDAAKNFISNAINTIKGLFNFKFEWPKIPMPHFSIKGSMNPLKWLSEGVPKLSVDWYEKGGIFDKPTLFNTPYGVKGVGEKGPEAVTPISKLQEMIDWNSGKDNVLLQKIIEVLLAILDKDNNLYIDGKNVSKILAPYIDKEFRLFQQRG
ncbi:hypothetical protein ABGF49_07710 [Helcococcus ovis]|uniref:hypothetical protein n=1 Tax=Helcococcus TaxID=31983 RepID=UPI0038BB5CA8